MSSENQFISVVDDAALICKSCFKRTIGNEDVTDVNSPVRHESEIGDTELQADANRSRCTREIKFQ